jgi:hypothetical protein
MVSCCLSLSMRGVVRPVPLAVSTQALVPSRPGTPCRVEGTVHEDLIRERGGRSAAGHVPRPPGVLRVRRNMPHECHQRLDERGHSASVQLRCRPRQTVPACFGVRTRATATATPLRATYSRHVSPTVVR